MQHPQPHPAIPSPAATTAAATIKQGKKRGNYNCGRCGQPKRGHNCSSPFPPPPPPPLPSLSKDTITPPLLLKQEPPYLSKHPPPCPKPQRRRRALDFDSEGQRVMPGGGDERECEERESEFMEVCLVEVMRRLPPGALLVAAQVCVGWRECAKRVWAATEEVRLSLGHRPGGLLRSALQKCPRLLRLSLRIVSDIDATVLAYVAFACPNLESLDIQTDDTAVNQITGDELGRFVAESRCLTTLKIEGSTNLGFLSLASSSLATLWLSDLYSLSKTALCCPNLKELSLDFARDGQDNTDLCNMMEGIGRSCPRLRNIHIASVRLSNSFVLALSGANLRYLRMLALVLGLEVTDASVAAITSSYSSLELLDLSGSSISDSGIGMICNAFPRTLTKLLLALCPNITSSGIQFASAQLPLLQLIDCGMAVRDPYSENKSQGDRERADRQKEPNSRLQPICQKLIIKHMRLKKLSLWGCSGLDALYLNCPELSDLNVNLCTNLHPERLLLQCPSLENVHASGCHGMLIEAVKSQVSNELGIVEDYLPAKRSADGSKRVQVPQFGVHQPSDHDKRKAVRHPQCMVHSD
ncbi:F-box/LRR-repeat protein 17 isoform X2 [Amborella trichopoda]|uniref:Uncharacterized protein n=1 Tax=Amborella trichopoda TaxID=13333 RepID=W1P0H0_AMBTC|nr:F-box/LRR-repeat protein 17 isoform X2 [Amborella trichopoda]ERN01433.1 hypothetical protein AMTR_s00002p00266430 [Amborella trichopoda]|eukprot:XP_006838864.1 F-box/LRR-repeat protein 17 isoform X2 [Amborella trichopoda]